MLAITAVNIVTQNSILRDINLTHVTNCQSRSRSECYVLMWTALAASIVRFFAFLVLLRRLRLICIAALIESYLLLHFCTVFGRVSIGLALLLSGRKCDTFESGKSCGNSYYSIIDNA